jgi:hypothetical protein
MEEIVRQDPPETKQHTRRVNWAKVVETLKATPGEFYRVGEFSPGVAAYLKEGRYKALYPDGEKHPQSYIESHYEITTRVSRTGESRVDLYIRWLG